MAAIRRAAIRRSGQGRRAGTVSADGWLGCCSFVLVLVAATGTLVLGIGTGSAPAQAANAATTYLTLSVTPTQGLVTGEPMTVTVSRTAAGTAAGVEIFKVGYAWCAPGTVLTPPKPIQRRGNPLVTGLSITTSLGRSCARHIQLRRGTPR